MIKDYDTSAVTHNSAVFWMSLHVDSGMFSETGRFNPHMHENFLQRYCMKWVPGDPLKEIIN